MKEACNRAVDANKAAEMIKSYVGGKQLRNISVRTVGTRLVANLCYEDFKPIKEVRRVLEDMIPNLEFGEITRDYSEHCAYVAMVEWGNDVYLKDAGGCLRPASILELVEEVLHNIDCSGPEWH